MIEPIKPIYPTYTRHDRPKKQDRPENKKEQDKSKTKDIRNKPTSEKSLPTQDMEKMLVTKAGLPDINARFQKIKDIQRKALRQTVEELKKTEEIIKQLHES